MLSYFVFTVLPFGLATACYAFTKLMRPLVRFWRGRGLRVVLYLDDGIVATKQEKAIRESEQVQRDLCRAGLVANSSKSQWVPSKQLIWLGFEVDLEGGQLRNSPTDENRQPDGADEEGKVLPRNASDCTGKCNRENNVNVSGPGTAGSHDDTRYVCCIECENFMVPSSATNDRGSRGADFLTGQYRQF